MVSGGGHGAKFTATDHTPLNVGKRTLGPVEKRSWPNYIASMKP